MNTIKTSIYVLINPMIGFRIIKEDRENQSYAPAIVIALLIIAMRVSTIFFTHFPLATLKPRETNLLMESLKILIPLFTWSVACFGLTTISDGKTLFKEQILASAYCMVPYLVLTGPIIIISHILGTEQLGLYINLNVFKWFLVIALFIISTVTMNEYTLKKAIGIGILSIIASVLIWILIGLFYTMGRQVYDFFYTIFIEYNVFKR